MWLFGGGCGCGRGSKSDSENKEVVREVVREVVVIPCKYCGTLFPQTATFCPNCGAKRTV